MGFREYYQIWFKRVESKNNISQFAFKIHRNQTSATFPQTQKEIIINEKAWQLAKEYIIKIPSLSGTDNEVMVQPRLVMSTRIVPLLSSKSSGFRFWSAIGFSFSLRIERERECVFSFWFLSCDRIGYYFKWVRYSTMTQYSPNMSIVSYDYVNPLSSYLRIGFFL